jgi:hypothetical protein
MVLGPLRWPDALMPRSTIVAVVVGATVVGTLCAFDHWPHAGSTTAKPSNSNLW